MAKRKEKKMKIFKFAILVFCVYMIASFVMIQLDISKRKKDLSMLQNELEEQELLNKEISNILESGENTDYIMRIAREKLGLVFPDERVFIDFKRKQ